MSKATELTDVVHRRLQSKYSETDLADMRKQRSEWLEKTRARPRDLITFATKSSRACGNSCQGKDCETIKCMLGDDPNMLEPRFANDTVMLMPRNEASLSKAPPDTIGMGRPVLLTGLEILWRTHVVLGHASIEQMLALQPTLGPISPTLGTKNLLL